MTLIEFVDKNAGGLAIFVIFILLFFVLPVIAILADAVGKRK